MSLQPSGRAVVLGSGGMLGRDLVRCVPPDVTLLQLPAGRIDLRDHESVARTLADLRPDVVVNAAAFTDVDGAERDGTEAVAVNATAVGALGVACQRLDITVCHFSTDYVFAGDLGRPYTEDDPPAPLGAYGRSKLAGERLLASSGARSLVVRTQWLFGAGGRCFPRSMHQRAIAGLTTRVVGDQRGCPTYTVDLAAATWAILRAGTTGLVHACNSQSASWYELAASVFEAAGRSELLKPCTTAEYPTLARRPPDSRLDTAKFAGVLGKPLPSWRDALPRFLSEIGDERDARG